MRDAHREALTNPAEENVFRQLRLNQWVGSAVAWIPEHIYDRGNIPIDFDSLRERECYGGLDLSSTSDITAFVLVFPPRNESEKYIVVPHFWLPRETLDLRVRRDHVPYDVWERMGLFHVTEGNVVDYNFVRRTINELHTMYNIKEIAADRWNATQLITDLEGDGFTVIPIGMGFKDMSPPIDVEFTADYSECVTYLIATDNFGNRKTIINSDVPCEEFPHHIYRTVKLSYDYEDKAQFEADAQAYFDNFKQASVNIKVKFADLSDIELYADFLRLADFEVGDKVIIYHKDLDINYGNLEIISKTYDVVSGETVDIEIGTFKNAISRAGFMPETASSGQTTADKQLAAVQSQLDEAAFAVFIATPITTIDGKYLTASDGKYLLYKE